MPTFDFETWCAELLDAYVAQIESADIQWATDGDGAPWIIQGQRRPGGIDYPHAMILSFDASRDTAQSSRHQELWRISTSVSVFDRGDPQRQEENLRQSVGQMAAVMTALYEDRSLDGTADYLVLDTVDAFEMDTDDGRETVADVQLTISKTADLR